MMSATPTSGSRSTAGAPQRDRGLVAGLLHRVEFERRGTAPDPRFTFANERTFLAWNRTALALIASGLAAAQFLHLHMHGLRLLIAVPLIVLGALLSLASYRHWLDSEQAMREGMPPPYSQMPRVLSLGIVVVAGLGTILAVIDRVLY